MHKATHKIDLECNGKHIRGVVLRKERPQLMPPMHMLHMHIKCIQRQAAKSGRRLDTTKKYLVYGLRRGSTPYEPFYIGKGVTKRPIRHFSDEALAQHTSHKNRIILKSLAETGRVFIDILYRGLNETTALALERFLIAHFGRRDLRTGVLANKTDGGEGMSGLIMSETTKQLISEKNTGHRHSEETKALLSRLNKGRPNPSARKPKSASTRAKLSVSKRMPDLVVESIVAIQNPLLVVVKAHVRRNHTHVRCRFCGGETTMQNSPLLKGKLPRGHNKCANVVFSASSGSRVYSMQGGSHTSRRKQIDLKLAAVVCSHKLSNGSLVVYDEHGTVLRRIRVPKAYIDARARGEKVLTNR